MILQIASKLQTIGIGYLLIENLVWELIAVYSGVISVFCIVDDLITSSYVPP